MNNEPSPHLDRINSSEIQTNNFDKRYLVQSIIAFILMTITYYVTAYLLNNFVSTYWVWAYYLSPIFMIQLLFVSIIYIVLQDNHQVVNHLIN